MADLDPQVEAATIAEYRLFIDGQWVRSDSVPHSEDRNPATGRVIAHVQQAGRAEALRAIDSAERAFPAWADMLASQREAILLQAADILASRIQEYADVLIDESGSVVPKAMFEVHYCIDLLRVGAGLVRQVQGETLPQTMAGQFGFTVRRPLGIVVGISPFNAPFLLAMKKVVFALAAGNCFVLKPSEETPVIGLKIAELFEAAGLPPGVLNVIPGPAEEVGSILLGDPRVRMITFTGSTKVGQYLAVEAAKNLKKFTLELGGKNPLIVLNDADVDYAVRAACFGIFFHQGQVCMANSRLLVEEGVYDQFCAAFVKRASGYRTGDPRDPQTVVGPLIRRSQCAVIDGQIEDALAKGATLLMGGTHEGNFYRPTVLAGVTPDMRIFNEESFGPVTSIIKVASSDEALALANRTSYGLSAGIITNDLQKAMHLALHLETGMVHINDTTVSDEPHVPFGGVKNSGFGREGGLASMQEMTELKWVTVQLGQRQFPL